MACQTITNAAREGCRVAVLEGSTDEEITTRIEEYLDLIGATASADIELTHSDASTATETVIVRVPYSSISLFGGYLIGDDFDLTGQAAMRKEGWTE